MLRLMIIIIKYLETTLFQSIDMLRLIVIIIDYTLPYDNYNTPQAQYTVGYRDRLKRTTL